MTATLSYLPLFRLARKSSRVPLGYSYWITYQYAGAGGQPYAEAYQELDERGAFLPLLASVGDVTNEKGLLRHFRQ